MSLRTEAQHLSMIIEDDVGESTKTASGPRPVLSKAATVRLPVRYRKECATLLVLISVATEFVGVSIGLPILVQYATSLGTHESNVGLVFSVSAFAGLLSNFWLPAVSDRTGRKPVLIFSLVGSALSYALQAASQSFETLLMAIFFGGMFGGTQPVAVAYISDIFSPAQRPRLIGMVPACASACYIIGPALGGLLSKMSNSFRVPLAAAAILVAAMLPIVQYFLPDSRTLVSEGERIFLEKQQAEEQGKMRQSIVFGSHANGREQIDELSPLKDDVVSLDTAYSPLLDWRCHVCFCIQFFNISAFSAFTTCVPLILAEPGFGLSGDEDAVFYTGLVIGFGAAFKSLGLILVFDRIQKRIGLPRTISLGAALSFFAFFILSFQSSVSGMAIGFALFSLGVSLLQPGIFSYVTVIVPRDFTARAIGVPDAAINLGEVIGPIASTNLLVAFGYSVLFQIFCAVLLVQLVMSLLFHRSVSSVDQPIESNAEVGDSSYSQEEFESFLRLFFVQLLKERNYNLADENVQKAVLEIAVRSYPFLRTNESGNKSDVKKLMRELNIPFVRPVDQDGQPHPLKVRKIPTRNSNMRASIMASTF